MRGGGKSYLPAWYQQAILLNPFRNLVKYSGNPIIAAPALTSPQDIKFLKDPIDNIVHGFLAAEDTPPSTSLSLYHASAVIGSTFPSTLTIDTVPVLRYGQQGGGLDSILISAPIPIAMPDGSKRLYYHAYNGTLDQGCVASCPSGTFPLTGWVNSPSNPILPAGGGSTWDSTQIQTQIVVPAWDSPDSQWHFLYGGNQSYGGVWRGGHATSTDGLVWTRDSRNPVLLPGSLAWNSGGVLPVGGYVHIGSVWFVLVQGWNTATSIWTPGVYATPDFVSFRELPGNPILLPSSVGHWDSGWIENPGFVISNGHTYLYYVSEATGGSIDYGIGLASN